MTLEEPLLETEDGQQILEIDEDELAELAETLTDGKWMAFDTLRVKTSKGELDMFAAGGKLHIDRYPLSDEDQTDK